MTFRERMAKLAEYGGNFPYYEKYEKGKTKEANDRPVTNGPNETEKDAA